MLIKIEKNKNSSVILKCDLCSDNVSIRKTSYSHWRKRNEAEMGDYVCTSCKIKITNSNRKTLPDLINIKCKECNKYRYVSKRSKKCDRCISCSAKNASRIAAENPRKGFKLSDKTKNLLSDKICYKWSNDKEWIRKQLAYRDDEWKNKISNSIKKKWANGDYDKNLISRRTWIQRAAESILNMLDIKYESEATISNNIPYSFDIKIGNILVELDGDYWHNLPNVKANDKRKNQYVKRKSEYKLYRIKEHEILCFNKLYEFFLDILNIDKVEKENLDFSRIKFEKTNIESVIDFINSLHYLGKPRKGGIAYKTTYNNNIIAIITLQRPVRQQVATSLGVEFNKCYEITRIVVNPKYHKSNIISWMLSRITKDQKRNTDNKVLVSFSDTTYGHTGACYKASNFKLHSIVKPDYTYIDGDGFYMHKKTLWDHAKKMGMSEKEFAEKYKYTKIYGKEKLKFIYWL